MRTQLAIERELRRCERAVREAASATDKNIAYGGVQALAWALGQDAAPPTALVQGRT